MRCIRMSSELIWRGCRRCLRCGHRTDTKCEAEAGKEQMAVQTICDLQRTSPAREA